MERNGILTQIRDGGCELVFSRDNGQQFEVTDARLLRRLLEQKLTLNAELRANFSTGLDNLLQEPNVLHAALKPMVVTGQVSRLQNTTTAILRCSFNLGFIPLNITRRMLL